MRAGPLALLFAAVVVPVGCVLFTDLSGLSSPEAVDAGADADDAGGSDVDAGPDSSAYRLAVLGDRPVAYWPLDDAPGATSAREIVAGRNADVVGVLAFGKPGVDGTALERVDGGGHLLVGDQFDLAGKQPYSIELWARPTILREYHDVLHKRLTVGGTGWIVYFAEPQQGPVRIVLEHNGTRNVSGDVADPSGSFHHAVFVYEGVGARVYVDGIRSDGSASDAAAADSSVALKFASGLVGALDEVAIYDHALSAERIAVHFQLGRE